MKLLLDQGLPRSAATLLRERAHDAVHVSEIGLATADDASILQYAYRQGRAVVTLDADFHTLLALTAAVGPSVVRIRVEGLKARAVAALIQDVVARSSEDLESGAVITVQARRLRVRRLPLLM